MCSERGSRRGYRSEIGAYWVAGVVGVDHEECRHLIGQLYMLSFEGTVGVGCERRKDAMKRVSSESVLSGEFHLV